MDKRLSIIVPVLNERNVIEPFLEHLSALRDREAAEVIVVDGGSTDGCLGSIAEFPVTLVSSDCGRAKQMNAGARAASGQHLLFVHADSRLPINAIGQILTNLDQNNSAGSFRLAFDSRSRTLKFFAWFTRFNLSLFRFGDQGLFVSRLLFHQLDGFDESLTLMEDQDMVRRLRKHNDFVILRQPIMTSARKYDAHGALRTQLTFTLIVLLYYFGASQRLLSSLYHRAFSGK